MITAIRNNIVSVGKAILTPFYRQSEEEIKARIDKFETISFDVFDTLIEREGVRKPEDVFELVGKHVGVKAFKKLRIESERTARRKTIKEDIKLEEMYERLRAIDKALCQQCMTTELEIEKEISRRKEEGCRLFNYAKENDKRIVIISNMYLSEEFIRSLLEQSGYSGFEKLFVSCEYGKRKGTGNLYRVAREYLKEEKWLHVGDNLAADVFGAKKAGVDFAIL